jgi:single-stranded-DNA-specific exonuclease
MNLKRRELDQITRDEAIQMAEERMASHPDDTFAFVLHGPHWHAGVIGITASRVAEHFHRPAVMLSGADGEGKGSARSAGRINIHQALSECADLLTRFGGHAFAAGLTLPTSDIPELRERLSQAVGRMVTPEALEPELEIDANLDLDDLNDRFWAVLRQFAPHGPENPRPLFWSRRLRQVGSPETMGKERKHLMLRVASETGGQPFKAIGFGMGHMHATALHAERCGLPLELVYDVDENHYRGQSSLQLRLKDLRVQER